MVSKVEKRKVERADQLYEHMLALADPVSGKVAISGPQAGQVLGCGAAAARTYLAQLVMEGRLVQVSETKTGKPTLYRMPAFTKGDVRTTHVEPKQFVEPMKMTLPPVMPYYSAERTLADRERRVKESSSPATQGASAQDIAKDALMEQETLMSKILLGYMDMYRALEEIAKG